MKKTLFALAFLIAASSPARAQKAGDVGAGIIVGNPTGITGKVWLGESHAIDGGIGYSTNLAIYGDYLWHSWTVLPQPDKGKLPAYIGVGAQVRTFRDAEIGIRAVVGVAYWLPNDPFEIFLEVVPVFRLTPHDSVGLDAGLGLRYYFK